MDFAYPAYYRRRASWFPRRRQLFRIDLHIAGTDAIHCMEDRTLLRRGGAPGITISASSATPDRDSD